MDGCKTPRIDTRLELKRGFEFFALDPEQQERLVSFFDGAVEKGEYRKYHKMLSAYVCLLLDGLLSGEYTAGEFENAMLNTMDFLISIFQ
jgi:hypothetical protein